MLFQYGDLDPSSAEFFLQEERLAQMKSKYELQCRVSRALGLGTQLPRDASSPRASFLEAACNATLLFVMLFGLFLFYVNLCSWLVESFYRRSKWSREGKMP